MHHPQKPALQEFNHSLTRLSWQLAMAPGVIFECEIASHAGVIVQCTIHKNLRFKNSITHSLTRLSRQLAMAPEVIFESCLARRCDCEALDTLVLSAAGRGVVEVAARQRCVLVQCTIHKSLHFKNSITHSLACLVSWPWRLK